MASMKVLKSRKLANLSIIPSAMARASSSRSTTTTIHQKPDENFVDARNSPSDWSPDCAVVYPNFLTPTEGQVVANDILSRMKR